MVIEKYIICDVCNYQFERAKEFKYCSNCFACTGCEVYYCPECDNEIIITPVKPFNAPDNKEIRRKRKNPDY